MGSVLRRFRGVGERQPARGCVSQRRAVLSALPRNREYTEHTHTSSNTVLSDRYHHTHTHTVSSVRWFAFVVQVGTDPSGPTGR